MPKDLSFVHILLLLWNEIIQNLSCFEGWVWCVFFPTVYVYDNNIMIMYMYLGLLCLLSAYLARIFGDRVHFVPVILNNNNNSKRHGRKTFRRQNKNKHPKRKKKKIYEKRGKRAKCQRINFNHRNV